MRILDLCPAFGCVTLVSMKPRAALRMRHVSGGPLGRWPRPQRLAGALALWAVVAQVRAAEAPAVAQFRKEVQPILANYCYDCHGDGMAKGNVAFDELKTDSALLD